MHYHYHLIIGVRVHFALSAGVQVLGVVLRGRHLSKEYLLLGLALG